MAAKRNRWRWCENIIDIIFTALVKQALSEDSCYFASGLAWLILSCIVRRGCLGVKLLTHSWHTNLGGHGFSTCRKMLLCTLHGNSCSFSWTFSDSSLGGRHSVQLIKTLSETNQGTRIESRWRRKEIDAAGVKTSLTLVKFGLRQHPSEASVKVS